MLRSFFDPAVPCAIAKIFQLARTQLLAQLLRSRSLFGGPVF